MKILSMSLGKLALEGRWDIDYHLPPVEIAKFPGSLVAPVYQLPELLRRREIHQVILNPSLSMLIFQALILIQAVLPIHKNSLGKKRHLGPEKLYMHMILSFLPAGLPEAPSLLSLNGCILR
jgi:hypothetical protein